jgi:hypothetical protein
MPRLNMIVEGQTEEAFVNGVLKEPLAQQQVWACARCVETSRDKKRAKIYRGGLLDYQKAKRDIERWMKEDQRPDAFFTTMFDLYALPADFPGFAEAGRLSEPLARVAALEESFRQDINHQHFIPYIQLHEFEALILSDPSKFDWEFIEHTEAIGRLVSLCASFTSPELIDDGNESALSKRIIREIPEYEGRKASAGPLIAAKIGLPVLRQKCLHFDEWLKKLEALT